jgi:HAD domain in Swiss Army Knife RNA repair proteins
MAGWWRVAEGDDDFTLVRKSFRDLTRIHFRLAQLERQRPRPKPVLFLDFDGVLVTRECYGTPSVRMGSDPVASPDCVSALNQITDMTGAVLVVSSSWRMFGEDRIREILKEWGVTGKVIGMTPILSGSASRSEEIEAWCRNNPRPPVAIILDDDNIVGH